MKRGKLERKRRWKIEKIEKEKIEKKSKRGDGKHTRAKN